MAMQANAGRRAGIRFQTLALFVFLVCLVFLLARMWGPRTITINAQEWPLAKAVASFERQGQISILTNVDLAKPVTLYLEKVPVPVALHKLAMAVGAEFRIGYIFAKTNRQITEAAARWEAGTFAGQWYQLRGIMIGPPKEHPQNALWEIKTEPGATLGAYLEQASISTGLCLALEGDPASPVPSPPRSGSMDAGLRRLARSSGMECRDYAMLIDMQKPSQEETLPRPGEKQDAASLPEPENTVSYLKGRLTEMPPERRAEAQQKIVQMEKLLQDLQSLPPEERKQRFFEKAPVPSGPGGGPLRPPGMGRAGGDGSGDGRPGSGGGAPGSGGSDQMDFREAEKHVERMESEMTPTQRADFFRTYVEKRNSP